MTFWLIVVAVTAVVCFIAFYPLLKKPNKTRYTAAKRDNLNKTFYFERLKELEKEADEGIIDDPEKTKQELQQSLLDDIPADDEQTLTTSEGISKKWPFIFITGVAAIGAVTYVSVGSWQEGLMANASHQKLAHFYERIKNEATEPLSESELNQFAMALRMDLQNNPNNAQGWFMLGQVGVVKDDGQLAFESYEKATKLEPNNLQYKSSYAQLLLYSADPADKTKGKEVLKEIIRQDHTNLDALSLLAFNAFEEGDYKMAAMTWGMMLKLIPEGEPRRTTVEKSINMAISMMKEQENKQPETDKK